MNGRLRCVRSTEHLYDTVALFASQRSAAAGPL